VTFAATGGTGGVRTERIASFDDYQSCVSAGRAMCNMSDVSVQATVSLIIIFRTALGTSGAGE
jgi:hypothetical protein